MLADTPSNTLFVGDAGFTGYDFLNAVLAGGRQFLVRVGANIKLLKQLGYYKHENDGTVYLWPDKAAAKKSPPLVFRLVLVQGPKSPLYLLTSVLSVHKLGDHQVATIYKARWGVEIYFRHLKQTFGCRKLRSHNADNARVELEWSLIGLWCIALYGMVELEQNDLTPHTLSLARALLAFRRTARDYLHPANPRDTLRIKLRRALKDTYSRKTKRSREPVRKKQHKSPGPPTITTATKSQIQAAKTLNITKKG